MSENSAMKNKLRSIIYIGDDLNYWQLLKGRLTYEYPSLKFNFVDYFPEKVVETQALFIDVVDLHPRIIYIDFSVRKDAHMSLSVLLKRDNSLRDIAVVGLVGEKGEVRGCLSSEADFIHIKCAEYSDAIFDPFFMCYPREAKIPKYAIARVDKDVDLIEDFRIAYYTPTSIHAEGNLELKWGEECSVETEIDPKLISSNRFKVQKVSESDLYFGYRYSYDLDFVFCNPPVAPKFDQESEEDKEMTHDQRVKMLKRSKELQRQRMEEYSYELRKSQKKYSAWVIDQIERGAVPKSKILVLDSSTRVLKEPGVRPLDQYPFSIRMQTKLTETMNEIDVLRPNIIFIQLFSEFNDYGNSVDENEALLNEVYTEVRNMAINSLKDGTGEIRGPSYDDDDPRYEIREAIRAMEYDDLDRLGYLVKVIKNMKNYTPFLVLCNCFAKKTQALQDSYQYPLIITQSEDIKMDTVISLTQVLMDKKDVKYKLKIEEKVKDLKRRDPMRYRKLTAADFEEKRYFVKKDNLLCYGAVRHSIVIESISESMISFLSERELELKTFRLEFPVEMSVRLILNDGKPFIEKNGKLKYIALIHSIDEDDKKNIRRVVNEIFLLPKRKEQEAEKKAFQEVNESALKDRKQEEDN